MDFDLEDEPAVTVMEETFGLSKIEQVQIDFLRYKDSVASMNKRASELVVTDEASNRLAVEMAGQSAAMFKAIEDKRKEIVQAPNAFVKAVNTFAKEYTSALDGIKSGLGQKITRWAQEQERKRLEAQRKANEDAQRLQAEINAAAKAVDEAPAIVVQPVVLEAPKVTRTASGSASLQTTWTFEVEDFSKVPDQYKVIDSVGLNKAVKGGIRQIPGVKIYEVQGARIRSASIPKWNDNEKF